MIKNYLQVAFRNLIRNKSYVIINTLGLGISLACCVAAYLLLAYNIEFDKFHRDEKVANVFKIHTHIKDKSNGGSFQTITAPMPMAPMIAHEVAGIQRFTRFIYGGGLVRYEDKSFSEGMGFVDSSFFSMFDFPLALGSHKSLKDKYSVFLSQEIATKYFGKEDPLGKILVMNFPNDVQIDVTVAGVFEKIPLNSSFIFGMLMRIENYQDLNKLAVDNWGDWRDPSVFVEVASPENVPAITKQLVKYAGIRNEAKKDAIVNSYQLEPFKSSFDNDSIQDRHVNLRIGAAPLIIFSSLALVILLIACFNLTNTSIAMTAKRLKEVGVRKAIGAARGQIVFQFLLETLITILLSLAVGLAMSQLIVPAFTNMWNLQYSMEDLDGLNLVIALILLVFLAALLAGIYPALFNSKFKPVALLKGNVKINGTNGLTRVLVAIQFALSVIVLVAGVMFIQNARFQEKIKFGYDKEMVLTVDVQSESEFLAMENEVRKNPKILNVAVCDHQAGYSNYQYPVQVDTSEYQARLMGVGKNYFETMGFVFAEGRPFNMDNASDQAEGVVVNKAFLNKVNMKDPLDKVVTVHNVKRHIIGVIENHVDNLYRSKEPEPFVFYPTQPIYYKMMVVRAEAADLAATQKFLEATWKRIYPGKPFESKFQEDIVLKDTKSTNANLEKIFLFLTVLGGLLSASGIFSLASLNIAKRTKEIGIRKALGATVGSVVSLLNREFIIILTIAGILGSVGGYFFTEALLAEIYAYHIAVSLIPVVVCALVIFVIGISTTSSTILRAAKANPVDSLRNE
jgi:ABC-type antimicrobial peptide transport system permease subunit